MTVATLIERKVSEAVPVAHLALENESHKHSVPPNSETHFKLVLVSDAFDGMLPVRRHQMLYKVLADEPRDCGRDAAPGCPSVRKTEAQRYLNVF